MYSVVCLFDIDQCFDTVGWVTEGHLVCKKLDVGLLVVMI